MSRSQCGKPIVLRSAEESKLFYARRRATLIAAIDSYVTQAVAYEVENIKRELMQRFRDSDTQEQEQAHESVTTKKALHQQRIRDHTYVRQFIKQHPGCTADSALNALFTFHEFDIDRKRLQHTRSSGAISESMFHRQLLVATNAYHHSLQILLATPVLDTAPTADASAISASSDTVSADSSDNPSAPHRDRGIKTDPDLPN
jgi:hypothetical protein